MTIEIPDGLVIDRVKTHDLPVNWREFSQQPATRNIGDAWAKRGNSAVLQVPSALIPQEYNFIMNPGHEDFRKIKLLSADEFTFDRRL